MICSAEFVQEITVLQSPTITNPVIRGEDINEEISKNDSISTMIRRLSSRCQQQKIVNTVQGIENKSGEEQDKKRKVYFKKNPLRNSVDLCWGVDCVHKDGR